VVPAISRNTEVIVDRKVKSFRLRVDLLAWVESYAKQRGSTQVAVLEEAIAGLRLDCEGGAPDLPAAPVVVPKSNLVAQTEAAKAAQEWATNMAARQRRLNDAKDRAS
jgi:hypothetical protein